MTLGFYVALKSTGILDISFDPSKDVSDSLTIKNTTSAGVQPGWLSSYEDKVYCVSRSQYPDQSSESGGIYAFQKQLDSGGNGLNSINDRSSNGKGGVHCEVSPDGKTLAVANINAATVSIYPLLEGGIIGPPTFVFDINNTESTMKEKGASPSPHECKFDESGRFMFVPLRSADVVYVYSVQGPEKVAQIDKIQLPAGTGPRHTACKRLSSTRFGLYLISENDNTVRFFAIEHGEEQSLVSSPQLSISHNQTLSILGKDLPPTPPDHKDYAAEIALSADGRFLYTSNRRAKGTDDDIITIFTVDEDGGLTFLKSQEIGGRFPRNFALSRDEKNQWIAVGNEVTQNVVVFERDVETGLLKDIRGILSLDEPDRTRTKGPSCILWK